MMDTLRKQKSVLLKRDFLILLPSYFLKELYFSQCTEQQQEKLGLQRLKHLRIKQFVHFSLKKMLRRDFLYWFLRQQRYKFIEISKGGAQPNISQSVINQTQIPIPDISVQERIVSFLFSIQNKESLDLNTIPNEYKDAVVKVFHTKQSVTTIESENFNQLDLLKKLRQQILQNAVQGKLVPQGPKDESASMFA